MDRVLRYCAQALAYGIFFVPLAYLTQQPTYQHMAADMAVLKIAIRHAGEIVGECETVGNAGTTGRPINMQLPEICPRERSPLALEVQVDGRPLYRSTIPASGLHNDGVSSMYQRFTIPSGSHHIRLLMNDDAAQQGYNWELERELELQPAQVVVASFKNGFRLQ